MDIRLLLNRWTARGVLVVLTLLSSLGTASAWSEVGHRVVAQLAQENLTDSVKRRMGFLVGKEATLVDFANWSDSIVAERPETEAWHSITVPPDARQIDYKRDCPVGDCTPVKVRDCVGIIRLAMKSKDERADALRMLVGLVGDLHQPLRAGYPPGQGSEDKPIILDRSEQELFDAWESALLERMGSEQEIVERVKRHISAESKKQWSKGGIRQWAWRTHQVALKNAYDSLPSGSSRELDDAYVARAELVIEEQLAKAAVRLAYLLEDIWP